MSGTARGARAPARTILLALVFALALAASIPAFTAMQANPPPHRAAVGQISRSDGR